MSVTDRIINVTVQNSSAKDGSNFFAGVNLQGDIVTGEASLRDRVVAWLEPIDPYPTQDRLRVQRTPGTGETFLGRQYRRWLESESRLLWLHGEGGSGKTFLSSLLVDRTADMLSTSGGSKFSKHTVAFFYCSFQDRNTQNPTNFLKSICAQLFVKHADFKELEDLYNRTKPFEPSQDELCASIAAIAKSLGPSTHDGKIDDDVKIGSDDELIDISTITIFIEGLDEVPAAGLRDQYFTVLDFLAKLKVVGLRIVVVSRFRTGIKHRLKEVSGWTWISRTAKDIEADIDLFNQQQISQHAMLDELDEKLKNSIRSRLGQGRAGMFRLAALQMQDLCLNTQVFETSSEIQEDTIITFLDRMPRELDKYHDQIMRNIPSAVYATLVATLRWITFASRPLFVEEVVATCAFKEDKSGLPLSVGQDLPGFRSILLEHLRGMVELRPLPPSLISELPQRTYTIELVHQTVREFLCPVVDVSRLVEQKDVYFKGFEADLSHQYLAKCCLLYLIHCSQQRDGRSSKFPLRSYAWHTWAAHTACSINPEEDKARPTLASIQLHNRQIYQYLYDDNDDHGLTEETVEITSTFDNYVGASCRTQTARTLLMKVIADPSFPTNIPEESWEFFSERVLMDHVPKPFRLVILHASADLDSVIECSLINESLLNFPQYETLSYVWGNYSDKACIYLNGGRFEIGQTLARILRSLRYPFTPRVLWIDAIAIDQHSNIDKNQQVALMAEIFRRAYKSVIYMGESDFCASLAIRQLYACRNSLDRSNLIVEAVNDRPNELSEGLDNILGRLLWRRLWLIQELVLARNKTCYCGSDSISWDDLRASLEQYGNLISVQPATFTANLESWRAFKSLAILSKRYESNDVPKLPELLRLTCTHECTDRRDMVIGLLGILEAEETTHILLTPDYSSSESEVYAKVTHYTIDTYQNLDILSYSPPTLSRGPKENLNPYKLSWAPDTFDSSPLCPGIFDPTQTEIYNAGGRQHRGFCISQDHTILTVKGVFFDHIDRIIRMPELDHLHEAMTSIEFWEELFSENNIDTSVFQVTGISPDDCWRTLCADRISQVDGQMERIPAHVEQTWLNDHLPWLKNELDKRRLL